MSLRTLFFDKGSFSVEEREFISNARDRFNASSVRILAAVAGVLFFVFWLGVQRGVLVPFDSPFWRYYRLFFGAETLLSLGYFLYEVRRRNGRYAGAYLSGALALIVALNLLGMRVAGDRSVYLLATMLCAFLYSAPLRWYPIAFSATWIVSVAGMAALFPWQRLLNNAVVLGSMSALAMLTGIVLESHRIATAVLTRRLEESNRELREISFMDPLTGLYNRRFLMEWLRKELSRAERDRDQRQLTIAIIDLDHFKEINDGAGHQAGDAAIRAASDIFRTELRSADVIARYGGDEFVAVLTDTTVEQARRIMERCLEALASVEAPQRPALTFSCGLAAWTRGESEEELIAKADVQLYRAKKLGRNRVEAENVDG